MWVIVFVMTSLTHPIVSLMVETVALQHQSSYLQVAGTVYVITKQLTPPQL